MSALDDLKDRIDSAIYTNTEQNITGDGLQTVLDDMVDTMGVSVSQNTLSIGGEAKAKIYDSIMNLNYINNTATSTYYTLATAVARANEIGGLSCAQIIKYRKSETLWGYAQYLYPVLDYIADVTKWVEFLTTENANNIDKLLKARSLYNINRNVGVGTETYSTLSDAISVIPSADRFPLMSVLYKNTTDTFIFAQYTKTLVDDTTFLNTANWQSVILSDLSQIKYKTLININRFNGSTSAYTLSTAIATIALAYREHGIIITFKENTTINLWRTYQYKGNTLDLSDWSNESNWVDLTPQINPSVLGCIDKTNGKLMKRNATEHCTNFIRVASGQAIRCFESGVGAGVSFYDYQFNYISSLFLTAGSVYYGILGVTSGWNIPSNAEYIRVGGIVYGIYGTIDATFVDCGSDFVKDCTSFLIRGRSYNIGSTSIGSVISEPAQNDSVESMLFPCIKGDIFEITGIGGSAPRLWGFTDTDKKLLSKANASITLNNYRIQADSNGYLVINNVFGDKSSKVIRYRYVSLSPAKWMAMGDSITEGWYSDNVDPYYHFDATKGWVNYVRQITGKQCVNKGIGGTGYLCRGPQGTGRNAKMLIDDLISNNELNNIELITLAYGVNDWKYNMVLGDMTSTVGGDTVIGCMRYVIEQIMATNSNIKIIVIMPINCSAFGTKANNYGIGYPFSNNGTLEQIYSAFKDVCDYYGIEYIDMLHSSVVNRENITGLLLDGVHPSVEGHKLMARELSMKINFY